MNDQDKPLGAPNLSEHQKAESLMPATKAKRKLNWKGFFIGIIIVLVIEFFAISMLRAGDPEIPIEQPQNTPSPTTAAAAKPTESKTLVAITNRGGFCQAGATCESTITVDSTGVVKQDGKEMKQLNQSQIQELQGLIAATDFEAIKKTKFTGTCPIAFDGQETVYTITTDTSAEELPGCKYEINAEAPLFKFLNQNIMN